MAINFVSWRHYYISQFTSRETATLKISAGHFKSSTMNSNYISETISSQMSNKWKVKDNDGRDAEVNWNSYRMANWTINNVSDVITTGQPLDDTTMVHPLEKPWQLLKQPILLIVLLTCAYVFVFVVSLTSNCLVIDVIRRNAKLHTVTNFFLVNLGVADILVTVVVLPVTLLANMFTGIYTTYIITYSLVGLYYIYIANVFTGIEHASR